MAKTKKPKTVKVWALTPEQADKWWELSDDEIETELGNESWERVQNLVSEKEEWKTLEEFATSCGITLEAMREGVKQGNHFPRKPESFDKMCRSLGFSPSEAGEMLEGIYAEKERNKAIDARGTAFAKLPRMEGVYRRITDPTDREIADVAIDALWRQLTLLADRKG
jgi:hypothetical protein